MIGTCAYCGKMNVRLTRDHLIPRSKLKNIHRLCRPGNCTIRVCKPCNGSKGDKSLKEWLDSLPENAPQKSYTNPHWLQMERILLAKFKPRHCLYCGLFTYIVRWDHTNTDRVEQLCITCYNRSLLDNELHTSS